MVHQYAKVNNPYIGPGWVSIDPNEVEELAAHTDKGYLLEVDVAYPDQLHDLNNDLPFMCERMEINCVEKLVPNLYGKRDYVIHIQALDQALLHGLVLECSLHG